MRMLRQPVLSHAATQKVSISNITRITTSAPVLLRSTAQREQVIKRIVLFFSGISSFSLSVDKASRIEKYSHQIDAEVRTFDGRSPQSDEIFNVDYGLLLSDMCWPQALYISASVPATCRQSPQTVQSSLIATKTHRSFAQNLTVLQSVRPFQLSLCR